LNFLRPSKTASTVYLKENSMRTSKALALAVVAAAISLCLAPLASASIATSPSGTAYTSTIKATAGTTELVGSFTTVKCTSSTVEGKVSSHGASVTVEGPVTSLTFSGCNFEVTVKKGGTIISHATGGGNATLTSTGAEVILHTSIGECVFTTNATDVGTGTGGSPASVSIASAVIQRTGGNFLCGSSAKFSGKYTDSTPSTLFVS
jgi:hypothetical protein